MKLFMRLIISVAGFCAVFTSAHGQIFGGIFAAGTVVNAGLAVVLLQIIGGDDADAVMGAPKVQAFNLCHIVFVGHMLCK